MPQQAQSKASIAPLPAYRNILLGVDASDYSNHGVTEALRIGAISDARVCGAHVYAAAMHDQRFRQMEGGLPARYQAEDELERQRDIHDDLITRGLSVITDSYLDQVQRDCETAGLEYRRCALEGKNYRQLLGEACSGEYDLLVLGARGLGAVHSDALGTVCERVTRRTPIDTLVVKEIDRPLDSGPIVVAVDGSARAFGGLLTGLALAQAWQVPLHVVSVYDPYYHYVAFNRIAAALSPEAAKVFRFKEQEKLHEEIIDAGLAKIYDAHLAVSRSIASDYGLSIDTRLLDGKPYATIEKVLAELNPSLLILGKTGVHADADLDIGGNTEHLLRRASCNVLISTREHTPELDVVAANTTRWSHEAQRRMQAIPQFAQAMARTTILRYAQAHGHTVITESIVDRATAGMCPAGHRVGEKRPDTDATPVEPLFLNWSDPATEALSGVKDLSLARNIRARAEKKARGEGAAMVTADHVQGFLPDSESPRCPLHRHNGSEAATSEAQMPWSDKAKQGLQRVPDGFMRSMTRRRVEAYAREHGHDQVREGDLAAKLNTWRSGSEAQQASLPWSSAAKEKLVRIPDVVRGMVMLEVERYVAAEGLEGVSAQSVQDAMEKWASEQTFHGAP